MNLGNKVILTLKNLKENFFKYLIFLIEKILS